MGYIRRKYDEAVGFYLEVVYEEGFFLVEAAGDEPCGWVEAEGFVEDELSPGVVFCDFGEVVGVVGEEVEAPGEGAAEGFVAGDEEGEGFGPCLGG
jgi:hypothetical protein